MYCCHVPEDSLIIVVVPANSLISLSFHSYIHGNHHQTAAQESVAVPKPPALHDLDIIEIWYRRCFAKLPRFEVSVSLNPRPSQVPPLFASSPSLASTHAQPLYTLHHPLASCGSQTGAPVHFCAVYCLVWDSYSRYSHLSCFVIAGA